MRPAVDIRILKPAPGSQWEFTATLNGEPIPNDGEAFASPAHALRAGLALVRHELMERTGPKEGGRDDA